MGKFDHSQKWRERDEKKKIQQTKERKKKSTVFELYVCHPKENRKMKELIIKGFPKLTKRAKLVY